MTQEEITERSLCALRDRLRAAAEAILPVVPATDANVSRDASILLGHLLQAVAEDRTGSRSWLLLTALSASFPIEDDMVELQRRIELDGQAEATTWALEHAHSRAGSVGSPLSSIEIVKNGLIIDVNYVARHELHTGIQRVIRETLPRWATEHDFALAVWTHSQAAMRGLEPREHARVMHWGEDPPKAVEDASNRLMVPWQSTVFLPEILQFGPAPYVQAMARFSGNRTVIVGYDCIPVVTAEAVPDFGSEVFAKYLAAIKYTDRIIGISASATREFSGFTHMLSAQGLTPPDVVECLLPVDAPPVPLGDGSRNELPLVLCVGSHSPHKNHLAVLHAAEQLWRSGLVFELMFVGGSSWLSDEFDQRVHALQRQGRKIVVARKLDDTALWEAYRRARFTVFPSLHEGFGLPVAESLAYGTPAITSNFGSMAEIAAEGGGALMVDPRKDDEITEAMRRLLVDEALLNQLGREARNRVPRKWDDYASELWTLVGSGHRDER